jgi:glucosamine kinase
MSTYAGIDGGGTRTRLVLVHEDGAVAGYAEGASYSFMDRGIDGARAELRRLWASAWQSAGEAVRPVDGLFMGTGSVLSEADARTNCDLAVELGLVSRTSAVRADNDAWNAHAGGLEGRPGILLIAGTGSACFGRAADGRTWRAGGWGYLLHDAGSGHALGQAAMVAATRDADGRGQPTALTPFVCRELGIAGMQEIFRRVHFDGLSRADVAALAPGVVGLADAGDEVATAILARAAAELAEMIVTVARRLNMDQPELAFTGGLVTGAPSFRRRLLDELRLWLAGHRLATGGLAPVFGAVLLAVEHATGRAPLPLFVETLRAAAARLASAS